MEAADGVIDALREQVHAGSRGLAPGEHLLVIRVADSAGNTGVAKVVLGKLGVHSIPNYDEALLGIE